ncbi:hypothetical protein RRG08_063774 [Elysia crispata]|uniref:Uncharacterized protein n=1 Tax=Elysia crispata TaxID=231223 RepID=A0AAE1E153_9GAST|nr:hypothetical protein RRG08_063774 [Elysia crispata]
MDRGTNNPSVVTTRINVLVSLEWTALIGFGMFILSESILPRSKTYKTSEITPAVSLSLAPRRFLPAWPDQTFSYKPRILRPRETTIIQHSYRAA